MSTSPCAAPDPPVMLQLDTSLTSEQLMVTLLSSAALAGGDNQSKASTAISDSEQTPLSKLMLQFLR